MVPGKAAAWIVLGIMPSLCKSTTLNQTDTLQKDHQLRLYHAGIAHVVEMLNKFASEDTMISTCSALMSGTIVYVPSMYQYIPVMLWYVQYWQMLCFHAYLDSLSMDGSEVAVNCLCSELSCVTCWCDSGVLTVSWLMDIVESANTTG